MLHNNVVEKIERQFSGSQFFFENPAISDTLRKNRVQPGRQKLAMWCMNIACWVTNTTNTHSEM